MAGNEFRYGQLIWVHFDFPDDEGDKEHPAIILQDQGDKLAVISGTSVSPNSYQSPHSYEFSHYWLFPNNLPHMKNGLTLTTFFELGVVRLVNKEKVSRISEILDKESLAKLDERTFIRAWFSDSESSKKKLKFGQVICCKKTDG